MRSTDLAANDAADDTCIRSRLTNQYATNHATGSVHAHTTCAHACNRDTPDRHPHTCTSRVASSTTINFKAKVEFGPRMRSRATRGPTFVLWALADHPERRKVVVIDGHFNKK